MSVRSSARDERRRTVARSGIRSLSKYDLLLILVPDFLLTGTVGGVTLSVPASTGAGIGSLFAALVVGYGLFVVSPVDETRREE